jgi:hypothetical protein
MRIAYPLVAALVLSGCASTYQLALMPRDSGKIYTGVAHDPGSGEGSMSITIEGKAYNGTWVHTTPDRTTAYAYGAYGYRRGWGGLGTMVTIDNPNGAEGKALLVASDGSGLRCDFRSGQGYGGGVCRDDRGREYDVQIRPAPRT